MTPDNPTHFFARQERARRNCRHQLLVFTGAVLIIVFITTIALRFVWYLYLEIQSAAHMDPTQAQAYARKLSGFTLFDPASFLIVASAVVTVILAACLYKLQTLKQGGSAVAEMLGAKRVFPGETDEAKRRLLNVVEEMAIAACIPVPKVYVMASEYNINAFAAGLTLADAAVAVTQGALDKLTRDELQGVIAHEFSHILNGDMRLNVQLIGILYGILFLGLAGRKFLSGGRISFRAGIPAVIAGFCLTVIGYLGSFLGRIMQCAISRQQELLADASAVQFTRNPLGLAGALKKIGGAPFGSRIGAPEAGQASHLFFSESHPDALFNFLSTHPPLADRIRLLDPSFDGKYVAISDSRQTPKPQYLFPYRSADLSIPPGSPLATASAAVVVEAVGRPKPNDIRQSQTLLNAIPEDIRRTVQSPQGAARVIYALLMHGDSPSQDLQRTALNRSLVVQTDATSITSLSQTLADLPQRLKLPLIELAIPALGELTGMEKRNFLLILQALINADGTVSLFELSVQWILETALNPPSNLFADVTKFSYSQVGLHIVVLLSALASAGSRGVPEKAQKAFLEGITAIPELAARKPVFSFEERPSYARLHRTLKELTSASFQIRKSVISACARCTFADHIVTDEERELLRVVALALQCPVPPLTTVG